MKQISSYIQEGLRINKDIRISKHNSKLPNLSKCDALKDNSIIPIEQNRKTFSIWKKINTILAKPFGLYWNQLPLEEDDNFYWEDSNYNAHDYKTKRGGKYKDLVYEILNVYLTKNINKFYKMPSQEVLDQLKKYFDKN